jgi:hypothetical protein
MNGVFKQTEDDYPETYILDDKLVKILREAGKAVMRGHYVDAEYRIDITTLAQMLHDYGLSKPEITRFLVEFKRRHGCGED